MPKKKSGTFDQYEYNKAYSKQFVRYKRINFNLNSPEDLELMEWLDAQKEGISNYLKRLIRIDMKKT